MAAVAERHLPWQQGELVVGQPGLLGEQLVAGAVIKDEATGVGVMDDHAAVSPHEHPATNSRQPAGHLQLPVTHQVDEQAVSPVLAESQALIGHPALVDSHVVDLEPKRAVQVVHPVRVSVVGEQHLV